MPDEILDRFIVRGLGEQGRPWTIIRLPEAFPTVRVVTRAHASFDAWSLHQRLAVNDEADMAHYLSDNMPRPPSSPWASQAAVTKWDGHSGIIEHDGACDLIVTRTYDPGWLALVNGKPDKLHPVDGGLQGLRLHGSGPSHVELVFRPPGRHGALGISLAALIAAVLLLFDARRQSGNGEGRTWIPRT
jgi:hypothetical protein